ncbi:MAG: hypothetical protein JSV63_02970 [Candidatus Aenigmatarchaeota archaeon]|nr:MAG: hypothetical protein JSV63_02970 [Candidatus Aenigmarchaeota archaeon]
MLKKKLEDWIESFNKKYDTQIDLIHVVVLVIVFCGIVFYWYFMIYIATKDDTMIYLSMGVLAACATLVWILWIRYIERMKRNNYEKYKKYYTTEFLGKKFWYSLFLFLVIITFLSLFVILTLI